MGYPPRESEHDLPSSRDASLSCRERVCYAFAPGSVRCRASTTSSPDTIDEGVCNMGLLKEFREFAVKGNAIDMAVGIIIGAAFGKIVSSLVSDVIMPPIGLLLGGADFTSLFVALNGTSYPSLDAATQAGAATLNYGVFIQSLVDFTIVAFVVFLLVKAINSAKRKEEAAPAAPPPTPADIVLLSEIRDLLKRR
jgi:large conductance mechanosensitive channel